MKHAIGISIFLGLIFLLTNCKTGSKKPVSNDVAYSGYIASYTSGVISIADDIRINMVNSPENATNDQLPSNLIELDPSVSGKTSLVEGRTLVFHPDKPLQSGQHYTVKFNLGKLKAVPENLKQFSFQFRTIDPDFSVELTGIRSFRSNGEVKVEISGSVTTSDKFPITEVEKIIKGEQNGTKLPVTWEGQGGNRTNFPFKITNVKRIAQQGKVMVSWEGSSIDVSRKGNQEVVVPAIGEFNLQNSRITAGATPTIELIFSDPLDPSQETNGLFMMPNVDFEVSFDDNIVKLVPKQEVTGEKRLEIYEGLKNYAGYKLGKTEVIKVSLKAENPSIRFIGDGNIVPTSDGIVVPFETINLSGVEIRIIKIFANNYHQFFQSGNLNEDGGNIKNVGRPVYYGVLPLTGIHAVELNKWSAYSLNISDLVKIEPGAIYQVELSMYPEYSLYPCSADAEVKNIKRIKTEKDGEKWLQDSYGGDEEGWSEYDGASYDWQNRLNPCFISYFIEHRHILKNVIASNIGLLAKRGSDNKLLVVATNLLTSAPQSGTEITVYDYQSQVITTGQTGSDGIITLDLERTPFLIVAKNGPDVGYLKISEGNSLQLSRFDIGGDEIKKGLKGFLYGERGVWRPGDSIFVSLIIEDRTNKLTADHPVIFELYSPTGQLEQKTVLPLKSNIITFKSATKPESPTGNWRLTATVGGAEFTKHVRIETIKPNRLKLLFNSPSEQLQSGGSVPNASLNAKWLQGMPAGSLKAKVDLQLKKGKTTFPNFSGYDFENRTAKYESSEQTIFDGKLNENGDVNIPIPLGNLSNAPGKLEAAFTVRVFEPGGDFSIAQFNKTVSPFSKYIGIRFPDESSTNSMLSCGIPNSAEFVVVDSKGNPAESNFTIKVYKIDRSSWWDSSEDYLGNFVSRENFKPVISSGLQTQSGKATFKFTFSNENWGRYLFIATLPDGHSVARTVFLDWPYGESSSKQGGATMLSFSADKAKYKVGEEVNVSFPSSQGGKGLVTIENGTTILDKFWVDTKQGQTKVTFKVTPEMAPNIFLYITSLQPYNQTINVHPIRLYGVIPVNIENPETHLAPVLKVPDELRSEQPFTVEVSEKNGKAMNYTIAIVDEGLLDLTGYKTPDPWTTFYAREALGVKTWDLYDLVLGAYGGTLEKLFAVGGSDQLPDPSKQKAQRFKPIVKFLGPFTLDKNSRQKHAVTLPQYTGSIRFMIIGASNRAYGISEKSVPVRDPLMVLATVPRVIGINETIDLPVNVFAQEPSIKNVEVSVTTNSLLSLTGENKASVSFTSVGEKDLRFNLKSGTSTGKGQISVTARSGNEKATYTVEVEVRNPNPLMVSSQTQIVNSSQSKEFVLNNNYAPGKGHLTVEVSSTPPLNLGQRLDYLIEYPHGCIEQTVSSAFTQLLVNQLIKDDADKRIRMESNIRLGIENLRKFQLADGSFSYWPGSNYHSTWGTSWAGNFMIEAENLGYAVPSDMKKRWLNYQKNAANFWRKELSERGMILDQAYRLYTLSLAGSAAIGPMNRLKETSNLPVEARWQLAAAYILASRPEVAERLVDMTKLQPMEYQNEGITFGSSLRDRAILLQTLSLMKKKGEAFTIAKAISDALCSDQWMSTQTTAACLLAMSQFTGKNSNSNEAYQFKLTVGSKSEDYRIQGTTLTKDLPFDGKTVVKITSQSSNDLFISVIQKGVPLSVDIPARQNGLNLDVVYVNNVGTTVNVANLPKGTDFTAIVKIKNTGYSEVSNLALTQVFPSGWEIINERLFGGQTGSQYSYRDIRDDRIMTYFDLKMGEQKEFKVKLNATYSGTYYLPPVQCEAMYNHLVSSNNSGMKVVIGN